MILQWLHSWSPIKIDALGIVSLLGAEEMNFAVGRLTRTRYIRYLPLLGAHTVAGNNFTRYVPGFIVYNITDRIRAADVDGWFARWLLAQKITSPSTIIKISATDCNPHDKIEESISILIGFCSMVPLLVMAVLMNDWYGLANSVCLVLSIIVRTVLVRENCKALDIKAKSILSSPSPSTMPEEVKTFWILPDGSPITIFAPRGVVIDCLLTVPRPPKPRLYDATRAVGWFAVAVHIVSLGMATLVNQFLTLAILLVPTILVARDFFSDHSHVGSRLHFQTTVPAGGQFRASVLARLELTKEEEDAMVAWGLWPLRSNKLWWDKYEKCKFEEGIDGFKDWGQVLAVKESHDGMEICNQSH